MSFEDKKAKIKQALESNTSVSTNTSEGSEKPLKQLLEKKKKNKNLRPKQTNVYLDEEIRTILDELGEALGKENGGKSKIVNDALLYYFKNNDLL